MDGPHERRRSERRQLLPKNAKRRRMLGYAVFAGGAITGIGAWATLVEDDPEDTPLIGDAIAYWRSIGDITAIEAAVHDHLNEVRTEHDLRVFEWSDRLNDAARGHSEDMAERDFFSHVNPDGEGPGTRMSRAGRMCDPWEVIGEATSTAPTGAAEQLTEMWMDSPDHRDIILEPSLTHVGVGAAIHDSRTLTTVNFCSVAVLG